MIRTISHSGAVNPVAMVTAQGTFSSDALLAKEGTSLTTGLHTDTSLTSLYRMWVFPICTFGSLLIIHFLYLFVFLCFSFSLCFPPAPTLSFFLFACLPPRPIQRILCSTCRQQASSLHVSKYQESSLSTTVK